MSYQEMAKAVIDRAGADVYPEFTPNDETLEAIAELENGGGHKFSGITNDLFAELLED
ncbi:MAG: hypothetical protein LUF00_02050 [Lachnospiraceae bacterium]|nr:hypothetical protein [Lachnospiraceae bacterium]